MDIQTRKLNLIEYLIGLKDEDLFQAIEEIVNKSRVEKKQSIRSFTQKELIERAKRSKEDYIAGNLADQENLEIESKSW